jgi:two-component sensor histidine kinase
MIATGLASAQTGGPEGLAGAPGAQPWAEATESQLLAPLRLAMVRVALGLGWVSAGVVLIDALSPSWHAAPVDHVLILALVSAAAAVNGFLGLLPWRRWMGTPRADQILALWAGAVVVLIGVFVHLGGYWAGEYYLLYFLVVPFIAATEPLARQAVLYAMALCGYLVAVLSAAGPHPAAGLGIRTVVLAGACVLSGVLAQAISQTTRARARAEASARLERLLADEAHHRIKNNLQLIADLLSMEAAKVGSQLPAVVEETLSRIQSVAAVHQVLAMAGEGRVVLRPVVERIVNLLADRLGDPGRARVSGGEGVELPGNRATWTALVVNELVTNALRHGRGGVEVTLEGTQAAVVLRVGDEGPGPAQAQPGLGLALVGRLVDDGLGGKMEAGPRAGGGWEVAVWFPAGREKMVQCAS